MGHTFQMICKFVHRTEKQTVSGYVNVIETSLVLMKHAQLASKNMSRNKI